MPAYDELVARIKAAGLSLRETDHGYCRSMYVESPDGLITEFTVDPPDAARIDAIRRADAHTRTGALDGGRSPDQQRFTGARDSVGSPSSRPSDGPVR